ncbi:transcriptional repressor LexA [candidate division KSB1 bacterium]|nr:transcriptional repressor LexA [candidate division KSB1 bacterium]RQW10766.1 MAG: transcriptional repressor LexA [candidate division KSB1 bacterium]
MEKLTRRQRQVFEIIIAMIKEKEYPPTLKELAERLGAASRNTAVKHLTVLHRKGYIHWEKNKARSIKILESLGLFDAAGELSLPLVGHVTAGAPMLAEENIERYVKIPRVLIRSNDAHFLLRVRGESMQNAGILDKDLVVVRSQNSANAGEIVVALLGNEATVKRLASRDGASYLKAENPAFADIIPQGEWSIQGKVVSLVRENVALD